MDFNEIFNPDKPKLAAIVIVLLLLFIYFFSQVKIQANCSANNEACRNESALLQLQGAFFITIVAGIPVSIVVYLLVGFLLGRLKG